MNIQDDLQHQKMKNIQKVWEVICSNCHFTICEVGEVAEISKPMCHEILTGNFGMHCVAAKSVPCLLSEDQKQNHNDVSKELIDRANVENFLKNIITGDETWIYGYDVETKAQFLQWVSKTSPGPKKAQKVWCNVKVMLAVFFDCEDIIHHVLYLVAIW